MTLEDLLDPCGCLIAASIWLIIFLGAVALTCIMRLNERSMPCVNGKTIYINGFGRKQECILEEVVRWLKY